MLRIQCQGCSTAAYADCTCSVLGHSASPENGHHPLCPMDDLGATVECPPGSDCCDGSSHPNFSHDQAANHCTADHSSHACASAKTCGVDGLGRGDDPDAECSGGHHGLGVKDCSVCRPVTIEVMPGGAALQTVGA